MLGRHPVDVMLLATDLGVARSFYGDTLGLEVLLEDEQFLAQRHLAKEMAERWTCRSAFAQVSHGSKGSPIFGATFVTKGRNV